MRVIHAARPCAYLPCRQPATMRSGLCTDCWQHYWAHAALPVPQTRMSQDDLIDEVEHLLGTDHPDGIAMRLGYANGATLARRLYRAGRDDLARRVDTTHTRRAA